MQMIQGRINHVADAADAAASRLWGSRTLLRHAHFLLRYVYDTRAFGILAHLGPLRFPHLGPMCI